MENQNREIELRFEQRFNDIYDVYYRFKNFTPEEIKPNGKIKRFIYKLFKIKKLTVNKWKHIMHTDWNGGKYDFSWHPNNEWKHLVSLYDSIYYWKNKFKTIDDIKKFEYSEHQRLLKYIKEYESKQYPKTIII